MKSSNMNIQVDEFAGDCIENSNNDSQDSSNPKFLSAQEISKLDPFRDDPVLNQDDDSETSGVSDDDVTADKDLAKACLCNSCEYLEDSFCCKHLQSNKTTNGYECVTKNPDVESLIKPEVLRVQQLVMWDCIGASSEMTNKNLRFGCYRNLYFWIYGKRTAKKGFRQPLPACLVGLVKSRYPDPDNAYSGFIPSSGKRKGSALGTERKRK